MPAPQTNKSLNRAVELLLCLSAGPKNLTQLSEAILIQLSGTLKILNTFMGHNLIRRLEDGRYTLGPKCCELARGFLEQNPLPQLALPVLQKYSQKTRMRYVLAHLEGIDQVNLLVVDSPMNHVDPLPANVGAAWPQATGQVLLAHAPQELAQRHLTEYPFLSGRINVSTTKELWQRLADIRNSGIAVVSVADTGVHMAAAPVFNHLGQVVSAIGQGMPSHKDLETGRKGVIAAAKEVSTLLGAQ